jgi:predicted nucleic acid-binding protein
VLVPLLFDEETSGSCQVFWNAAHDVTSSHLAYVECAAALAAARRSRRITLEQHRKGRRLLDGYWTEIDVIAPNGAIIARAADLAAQIPLRAYDAVHCASAESIGDQDLVAAAGDRQLLAAWASLGIVTFDANDPG